LSNVGRLATESRRVTYLYGADAAPRSSSIRYNLATRYKASPPPRLALLVLRRSSRVSVASLPLIGPPHEYALGATTGAIACGNAAALLPFFCSSPRPPLDSSAPPQQHALRSPPQQYTHGAPTGATACGNAAAASKSSFFLLSHRFTACATAAAASSSPPLDSPAPQFLFLKGSAVPEGGLKSLRSQSSVRSLKFQFSSAGISPESPCSARLL
jgi:hypothetical protein